MKSRDTLETVRKLLFPVIPAQAGIYKSLKYKDASPFQNHFSINVEFELKNMINTKPITR